MLNTYITAYTMISLMLLFVPFLYANGAHLSIFRTENVEFAARSDIKFGSRTKSDIIITCLATILACTWTAMHPNISGPADSKWDVLKRRIRWTVYAIIAPEVVTTFALRQRLGASWIADIYNQEIVEPSLPSKERQVRADIRREKSKRGTWMSVWHICRLAIVWLPKKVHKFFTRKALPSKRQGRVEEWKISHGFFVQMGGFMLAHDGQPLKTLSIYDIIGYINAHKIVAPTTSDEDIHDRGKGNAISKTFIIIQTTWFFSQCIARWSVGLVITELEVITLGFVLLNGLTYAFWWYKPQHVEVPVYLEWVAKDLSDAPPVPTDLFKPSAFSLWIQADKPHNPPYTYLQRIWQSIRFFLVVLSSLAIEIYIPFDLMVGGVKSSYGHRLRARVSMFDSAEFHGSTRLITLCSMSVVAILFGTVHLASAWFLVFPTPTYAVLWKTCAIILTAIPCTILPTVELSNRLEGTYYRKVCTAVLCALTFVYSASRISLFVVALISLKNVPPNALSTVDWLSIFPHI